MPEVSYETTMNLPPSVIWAFVRDMNHWAPMLTGYQGHEILDERRSVWTLKGDVGILSRTVRLDVNITEWIEEQRVAFTLRGLNEQVEGGGHFTLSPMAPSEAPPPAPVVRPGLWRRLLNAIARLLFRAQHGSVDRVAPQVQASGPSSRLIFTLRMDAGGPTGPLVNAMLEPALLPAAEDLGMKIAAHLERVHRAA